CGAGAPDPTVAPITMSATAAAATAEAATTRRLLRSARSRPRQPGIGVTAPPRSYVPGPAGRGRRPHRPGGCPRPARPTAPPPRAGRRGAGGFGARGPRPGPGGRRGGPRQPQRDLAAFARGAAPPPLAAVRAGNRPHQGEAQARATGPAELGTGPEPVEDPVKL